jgi:hypothetical protein
MVARALARKPRESTMTGTIRNTIAVASCASTALAGCVVIPLNPDGTPAYPAAAAVSPPVVVPASPAPQQISVRLYPANDVASATGVVGGQVTNYLNGRGTFMLNVGGETLSGEATRSASGAGRDGVANAYGARGTYANCRYTMNSPTQGMGTCTFSNGAQYQLHIGS